MKNTVELSARAKAAILETAKNCIVNGMNRKETVKKICQKMQSMGIVENNGLFDEMLAIALSFATLEEMKQAGKKPIDCLRNYVLYKFNAGEKLNDFGFFGDIVETCTRVYSKPSALVQWNDLHVKRQYSIDLKLRGVSCEIGTNGKTFNDSTKDGLNDKIQLIIYGTFSDIEKEKVYFLFKSNRITEGIEYIMKHLYVFTVEQFINCMNTCGTAKNSMLVYKGNLGKYQVAYTEKRCYTFRDVASNMNISTLPEYLNK